MYEIVLSPPAERELRRLPKEQATRIAVRLRELQREPRPPGCRKLSGSSNTYRVRVGPLRIVYAIDDRGSRVRVVRIRQRSDAYR